MTRIRSSLAGAPRSPTTLDEMHSMRERAWRDHGVLVVPLDDVINPFEQQFLTNIGTRLYGARK